MLQLLLSVSQIKHSIYLLAEMEICEEERASSDKNLHERKEVCACSKEIPRMGGLLPPPPPLPDLTKKDRSIPTHTWHCSYL